jgi:hypothetical protein
MLLQSFDEVSEKLDPVSLIFGLDSSHCSNTSSQQTFDAHGISIECISGHDAARGDWAGRMGRGDYPMSIFRPTALAALVLWCGIALAENSASQLSAGSILDPKLGTYSFKITTTSDEAQAWFN